MGGALLAAGAIAVLLPAMVASAVLATPTGADAQVFPNNIWCASLPGNGNCNAAVSQSCHIQWQWYHDNIGPAYAGDYKGVGDTNNPTTNLCMATGLEYPGGSLPAYYFCVYPYSVCPSPKTTPQTGPCEPCQTDNNDGTPSPSKGQPIDILSGNEHVEASDFVNASGTLALKRIHHSLAYNPVTPLNHNPWGLANWQYDFQFELQVTPAWTSGGAVLLTMPGGATALFSKSGSASALVYTGVFGGAGYATPQTDYTLSFAGAWPSNPANLTSASTTWTLTGPDDTVYTLQTFIDPAMGGYSIARPVTITRRNGAALTLSYGSQGELTSISDAHANSIAFTWLYNAGNGTPAGIKAASLPGGYGINYLYSGVAGSTDTVDHDLLTCVQYLDATPTMRDSTSYQYGSANFPYALTAILDSGNVQRWGATYDNITGQAIAESVTGAAGAVQSYTLAYQPVAAAGASFTRMVTNPLGKQSVYTYLNNATQGLQLTSVVDQASPLSPTATTSYSYGSDAFASSIQDAISNVETQTHDPRGMPAIVVEAYGTSSARTTTTTWDPVWKAPDTIVTPTVTTAFVYNAAGAATSKTLTDDTTFTVPYPTNGVTRTWKYDWNTSGQLLATHGPRWVLDGTIDTTSFGYNSNGYLQTITNALGQATTVSAWDWRGAPLTLTDPNAVATQLTYDIHGRLMSATVNPGSAQSFYQFGYDAVGDLTQVTLPMGASLQYVYDQGRRLTKVTNVRGEKRSYTYDNDDDPLTLITAAPAGPPTQIHVAAYDDWGRILRSIGAASQVWSLAYDKLSNLTATQDPSPAAGTMGARRTNAYDPLNRLTTRTDPLGRNVNYQYDAADILDQFTDARSLVTTREIDGFGEVIQEVSADRGTLSSWYDASGNLTKRIDGDAVVTNFVYDNANRRTNMKFPSDPAENTAYTYDQTGGGNVGIGRLTKVAEASGSTSLKYDAQGRIVSDAKVVSPGGYMTPLTAQYGYDSNGAVTQITYPSGDTVNYGRTTDGLVTGVTFTPHGGSLQTIASGVTYEPYGPIAGLTYGNGLILSRAYDQDYRLSNLTVGPSSGSPVINLGFTWQNDGRLASSNDAVGNRTPTSATSTLLKASPASGSNQITGTTTLAGATARTLSYSTGGLLTQDVRAGSTTYVYGYNAARRLTGVTQGGSAAGAYAYDFAGRRVWRQTYGSGAAQTAYVYDRNGHLLAEHDATTGAVRREYVWIGDMPIALADISGSTTTVDYIHTGQIDEPLEVTNGSQAVIWNGYVDPFGNGSTFTTPSLTPGIDMRLPGQSSQLEMGSLSQNRYRDYDPSLGRYIEADPLGIDAGQNVYAYVDGDPLNEWDPGGLDSVTITYPGPAEIDLPNGSLLLLCFQYPQLCTIDQSMASSPARSNSEGKSNPNCKHKEFCDEQLARNIDSCKQKYNYGFGPFRRCMDRAMKIYAECLAGEPEMPPWSDINEDGWVAKPPPRRAR